MPDLGRRAAARPVLLLCCALAAVAPLAAGAAPAAAAAPEDLLPAARYDPAVPRPADVLGWEVGEWHVRHDQLVAYLQAVAAASPRARFEVQGYTYEQRPLPLLILSSPENLARLDDVRRRHLAISEPPYRGDDLDEQPVVVWLGYSIHGNEASGSNAALLVAYHLAAALDGDAGGGVDELLRHTIVLLDPSLNPDGLGRFAEWANMHRGEVPLGDRDNREHDEAWPGGRTNHYWFDLNRDWLPAQHPETRARLATMRRWRPNLLADFHEMGSDGTYFFQPGVPSRQNPLTPAANLELTRRIARYHADAFDAAGRLYYTEETFDDFYYGKGSTYPDVQGAVGILFEQASARGQLVDTDNGPLSFRQAIRGHVLTSFSTLRAAHDLRGDLLAYQASFFRDAAAAARSGAVAYLVADGGDPMRAWQLLELLAAHGIEVRELAGRGRPRRHHLPPRPRLGGTARAAPVEAGRGAVRAPPRVRRPDLLRHLRLDPAARLRPAHRRATPRTRRHPPPRPPRRPPHPPHRPPPATPRPAPRSRSQPKLQSTPRPALRSRAQPGVSKGVSKGSKGPPARPTPGPSSGTPTTPRAPSTACSPPASPRGWPPAPSRPAPTPARTASRPAPSSCRAACRISAPPTSRPSSPPRRRTTASTCGR